MGDLTEVIVVARPEVVISIASSGEDRQLESDETTVIESDLANISLSCDLVIPGTRHQAWDLIVHLLLASLQARWVSGGGGS